jgi:two-component system, OmpR family, response regulator ChvI
MSVIGIVDDDKDTRDLLKDLLEAEGYDVLSYADGLRALSAFETRSFDLAILDVRMPELDGIELLRRLRRTSDLPVIFMTGWVDDVNELVGLRVGADDFVHKPFSSRVLLERVRAVLRRARSGQPEGAREAPEDVIERGHLRMDRQRYTCSWKGRRLDLTATEFRLLESLAARPGTVRSRDALRDLISEDQMPIDERTIDSHIKRIRRKFRAVDSDFDQIEAIYGIGYRFSYGAQ